jgi:glucose/arabinose dehydrogenase
MQISRVASVVALAGSLVACCGLAQAQFTLRSESVASGLVRPLYVTAPDGDFGRLFVVEQRSGSTGRIRIVNLPGNTLNATPYLSISPVSTGSEQGLLGLAFHPNFLNNGYFWVNYTIPAQSGISAGSTRIVRYRANAPFATSTTADAASATTVLEIRQPEANHNGGWIDFGPDGNLYIGMGDGGCANDQGSVGCGTVFAHATGGNAQSLAAGNLLGKMLRIDVDGPNNVPGDSDDDGFPADATRLYSIPADNPFVGPAAGDDEIWMRGLRNPWRNAFDRQTGDLWIADVGQDEREEITFVPFGQGSGWNLGWRCLEGTRTTGLSGCSPSDPNLRPPIVEYGHNVVVGPTTMLGCSITGGVVYRGSEIPCFAGHYIFADYCAGQIWSFRRNASGQVVDVVNRTAQLDPPGTAVIQNVLSFGEDAAGNMYICDQTGGEVFRIRAGGSGDCNNNGIIDSCEIAAGLTPDTNNDGIPDVCQGTQCNDIDFNNDGASFDPQDIDAFLSVFSEGPCVPGTQVCDDIDFNNDGALFDPCDIDSFLVVFSEGPCTSCGV